MKRDVTPRMITDDSGTCCILFGSLRSQM